MYRYSVIPGGATSRQELTDAISRDSVVAAHYRSISIGAVRAVTVKEDRMVYVSYRRNNQIFWTKHQVRLSQGETILTDGVTQIRGRCGNCISVQPMGPTAEDEPETTQFDALTTTQTSPPAIGNIGIGPGTILLQTVLPSDLGLTPVITGNVVGPLGGGVPFGGSGGTSSSPGSNPASTPNPLVNDAAASFPVPVPPITVPSDGNSNGSSDLPADSPFLPPTTDTVPPPPLIVIETPPVPPGVFDPPQTPPQTEPVPEPGTLLLIGGGLTTLLSRHRRFRSR